MQWHGRELLRARAGIGPCRGLYKLLWAVNTLRHALTHTAPIWHLCWSMGDSPHRGPTFRKFQRAGGLQALAGGAPAAKLQDGLVVGQLVEGEVAVEQARHLVVRLGPLAGEVGGLQ